MWRLNPRTHCDPGAFPGFGKGGGGFGGMLPREIFVKLGNLVRFGVYFDQILSLKIFQNYHFSYKNFKTCNFLFI